MGSPCPSRPTLLQGTVDLLILKALAFGPDHSYGVAVFIRQRTEGALALEDAALSTKGERYADAVFKVLRPAEES